ncbi:Mu-like prophage major head subunit gpT family protein [Cupriavidus taiwanensis]|uniref:Mu-like prophage major head subunit gpT family protein n=1 Tax=Cupriavidus taiwanensis TaxID=164546 RepID=UPI0003FAFBF9|nr:Mu-like prophage major head subunit gpT family protein [Cupriavidus taiwanensis]SOZ12078.1 Mu-like prophage FluMu major head subunit [Cupriavidus taiwanensis]
MKRTRFQWGIAIGMTVVIGLAMCLANLHGTAVQPADVMPLAQIQPGHFDERLLGFMGAGIIINRGNLNALFQGFKVLFQNAFTGAPADWDQVAMRVPSTTAKEVYPWLGQTTRFREWIGDRVLQNLMLHDFTIKNKPWENTVTIDRDEIEDDVYNVYGPMISQLGLDAKQHPDELVFALLASGFGAACYDGQYFFDTDHPVLQADGTIGSVSNFQGGAGTAWYLLDTSKMVKPLIYQVRKDYKFVAMDQETDEQVFTSKKFRYGVDARSNVGFGLWQLAYASKQDLTADNYGAARAALMSMKGDNGKPLGVRPSLLVVPPSLEGKALSILQAEKNANGADNIYRNTAKLLTTPWLS